MLVKDVEKLIGVDIPDDFIRCLPHYCAEENCGYPMEMSEVFTQLHCSNPRCPSKVVQRLIAMASQLGVKDLGESKAYKFIQKFGISNPLLIFQYEPDVDGALGDSISLEVSNKIVNQFLQKNKFTLSEYVKIANLPFIQSSAVAIFGSYDDLYKAYEDIEAGGVNFIRDKLSIGKGTSEDGTEDVSVRALRVFDSLMEFKEDLLQGLNGVQIIETNNGEMRTFKAVCSDEVGSPFRTKADFYTTVNNKYPDIHVEFLGAVNAQIDYLIWAGADGSPARYTNKVKKVEGYNEKYKAHLEAGTLKDGEHEIPILTANQFLEMLDKL